MEAKMSSEDGKALSDKIRKRTSKTPTQLEALETFYDEHNYPSEVMKLQLAEKIGLTEKQVNSWFCHRRLKDKRLLNGEMNGNGRKDRSSGVKQDSCGSTKQVEDKTQDPIEVQSSRFNSQHLSAAGLMVEHGNNHAGNYSPKDDTSSGSSPSPHNLYSKVDHVHMSTSKLSTQNVGNFVNFGKPRPPPSGYLKVKPRLENPVITALKMQLGAHYRNDGPPLSIEFDPLPPGAFEPATQQPENTLNSSETYSAEEHVAQGIHQECISKPSHIEEDNLFPSEDGSRVHKKRVPNAGYGCTPNMRFPENVLDGKNSKTIHKSVQSKSFFFQKPQQEFPLSEHRSVDMHEYSPSRTIRSAGGSLRGTPAGHDQFQPYSGGVKQEHEEPRLKNSNGRMPKVEQRDSFNPSYPDFMVRKHENEAYGDKGLSHEAAKVGSLYEVKGEIDDDVVTDHSEKPRKNKKHMVKDEYPHQHVRKV